MALSGTAAASADDGGGGVDRCPWTLATSDAAEPMVYGYRGQIVDWDYLQGVYRVNAADELALPEEMLWRYDDLHRLYCPYRRLIGAAACTGTAERICFRRKPPPSGSCRRQ